jgi:hypothetical protein
VAHNAKWNGSSRLRFVLNGVRNCAPGSSRRPPHPPVNSTMLEQLVRNLDLTSPLDAAVAACAVTAFWGQCQIGELLPLSSSLTLSSPLPSRSDFKRSIRNPHSCVLRLPCTKTQRNGEDVVLVDQRDPINPISLLKNHFRVNHVRDDQFLFSLNSVDFVQDSFPSAVQRDMVHARLPPHNRALLPDWGYNGVINPWDSSRHREGHW